MFIATYGLVSWIVYGLATDRIARALKGSQRAIGEMLFRWIANGGTLDRFWQLRDQMDVDAGDIDMDSDRYRRWWYEMKADLVDNVIGETAGHGSWRPRYYGW